MKKLSKTQMLMLYRLSTGDGVELCPGGYATAGRDASRWWRTAKILMGHGLVTRRGWQAIAITDAGRTHVRAVLPPGGGLVGESARALILGSYK